MELRPYTPRDLDRLIELTIETFRPFYEESFRSIVGETVFVHQHGNWRDDYHEQVPKLHDPEQDKYVAIAENAGQVVGYVAWSTQRTRRHGAIEILAVAPTHRREGVGTVLCERAMSDMKKRGAEVVEIGTGGDAFHGPARALYESLGCTLFPTAVYFKQLKPGNPK